MGIKNKGFSLIEVLIALSVTSLAVLGVVRILTVSINNSNYSGNSSEASSLARKKIAQMIDLRNSDPDSFFVSLPIATPSQEGNYCIVLNVTEVSASLITLIPTQYPSYLTSKMAKISAEVFWNWISASNQVCDQTHATSEYYKHSIKIETYVTN